MLKSMPAAYRHMSTRQPPRLAEFCLRPKAFWADADAATAAAEENAGTVSLGQELNFAAPSTLTQWYLAGLCGLAV